MIRIGPTYLSCSVRELVITDGDDCTAAELKAYIGHGITVLATSNKQTELNRKLKLAGFKPLAVYQVKTDLYTLWGAAYKEKKKQKKKATAVAKPESL